MATLITQATVSYLMDACNRSTRPMFWMKTRAIFGGGLLKLKGESSNFGPSPQ